MLKIPGDYCGKKGLFEFIKEADGPINHILFRPNPLDDDERYKNSIRNF